MDQSFLDKGLAQTTLHPIGIRIERGQGSYLYGSDGQRYLDFISGIGVSSFGHGHPEIVSAVHAQVDKHLHAMVYGEFRQAAQEQAAANLLALLPEKLNAVYFVNSGAEAIDAAMKLARRTTGRSKIQSFTGGYHGNTFGALSVSSNVERKSPFLPLVGDVELLSWNDDAALNSIDDSTAAVILETIQGDAGIRIPDTSWLQALRKRCTETGTLLILDEIQCGMGRTGSPFAFEHFDVQPDVLCLGKALGGGLPIGAVVANRADMIAFADAPALGHITTFGGHPVPCAASAVATRLLSQMDWHRVETVGLRIESTLRATAAVKDVRRKGLYIAVVLESKERVNALVSNALEQGVLVFYFLSTPDAFRIAPPLNITDEELEHGLAVLQELLDA